MGLYIKGMRMPENCDICRFGNWSNIHQTVACELRDNEPCFSDFSREYRTQRSTICPLVDLGKHGRLIDADELWNKMSNYTDNDGAKFPFGDDDSIIHRDSACFMIESADTIIEAEENK